MRAGQYIDDESARGSGTPGIQASEESLIEQVVARLSRTMDAVSPAARVEKDRQAARAQGRSALQVTLLLAYALAVSIAINVVVSYFALNPVREYFATDRGRLIRLVPLSEPYRTPAEVIQFARDTLNASFALDFLNYRADLERARELYSPAGFSSFIVALQQANILDKVKKERFNLTNTTETGVLANEGLSQGVYVWQVQMPLELRLVGQNTEIPPQKFLATVRVERTSNLASREGIVVAQVVTKPMELGR